MMRSDDETDKMVKNSWTPEEDQLLRQQIRKLGGPGNWTAIAEALDGRSSKSCRLRWCNQLNPTVKRGPFTAEEDRQILAAHAIHGNKWAIISRTIPGRTDNQVKNRFNSTLRRLHGHLRRDASPASPVAGKKRKAKTQASAVAAKMQARPAAGSPASGDSAGTVHATSPAESDDESDAIAGLEQLVQASLEVQRAESGGEEEEEEAAAAAIGSAAGGSETGDVSVRGARAYASDVREQMALAAGIQSQQAMYQAQLRHQLTMAQMASYAGSAATQPAAAAAAAAVPSFHAPRVETNAAAANGNAHALLHAQLVAAMQNPATVGALYQRLLMEQMMGMGAASAAAPAEATARPASSDASEASATATIPAWFGAFGGMDPATAARAMTIATGGIPTAL